MKMSRIEPTKQISFTSAATGSKQDKSQSFQKDSDKGAVLGTLSGLAVLGLAALGLKKTSKMSFEEALKKNGVEIKDGVATLIKSGEKFTGKIQRFEKRNRKESVKFVDGVMTEKLYHNILGKELDGYFYKNGACYKVYGSSKLFTTYLYIDNRLVIRGDAQKMDKSSVFDKTREYVASSGFDKLVQETKEGLAKIATQ